MLILVVMLFSGAAVFADVITTIDGNQIHGKVLEEHEKEYLIQVDSGRITISKNQIASIDNAPWSPASNVQAPEAIKTARGPSLKEKIIIDVLFWFLGFFLYAALVYLVFRIVDIQKKLFTALIFSLTSLMFFYVSSFFVFSQIYFSFANIMLIYFFYDFGPVRSFLFGIFFTWVIMVSSVIFFTIRL
ncbi:hypothetical protein IIB34_04060 [PVC group bacterium]|nr:hypothetical protein [PVC group bacterium]